MIKVYDSINHFHLLKVVLIYPKFFRSRYEFKTYSTEKQESIKNALSHWSDVTGIEFIEVDEASTNSYGDIRFFYRISITGGHRSIKERRLCIYHLIQGMMMPRAMFLWYLLYTCDGYFEHLYLWNYYAIGFSTLWRVSKCGSESHETIMSYDDNYFIAAQPMPADIELRIFYMVAIPLMQTLKDDTYHEYI